MEKEDQFYCELCSGEASYNGLMEQSGCCNKCFDEILDEAYEEPKIKHTGHKDENTPF